MADVLVQQGKLETRDLERALQLQQESAESLETILVKLGVVSERDVAQALASHLGLPLATARDFPEVPIGEGRVAPKFLRQHKVLPLAEDDTTVTLAMADPLDNFAANAVALATKKSVLPWVGVPSELEAAIEQLYGGGRTRLGQIVEEADASTQAVEEQDVERLKDLASEAPVIRLANLLIDRAVEARASDIHIEPFENKLKVRYRIDGMLREVESPPAHLCAALTSRVKLMAKLDIAERRLPQDGRIQLHVQGKEIDLRVSSVPTMYGESVVMRILDKTGIVLDFPALGFQEDTLRALGEVLNRPQGIILVTGPTGSGKTTTLYTALHRINTPVRKILTVEDPVEYYLEGINQIQVKPQIGLTFANALRSIVRQDPDVIMIGEMRDLETASIAVQSALTGHLVLSTLHTNSAAASITRLLDMGVQDYLLTSTISGILSQRLARALCTHCRRPTAALPEIVEKLHLREHAQADAITLFQAVGCEQCRGTGYRGRLAIGEMLIMSDPIRQLILRHADASEIHHAACAEGMRTMYQDGLQKLIQGTTSLEEVLRVVQEE
jgi:general secretion pathway protein E